MKPSPSAAATVALYRRGVRSEFINWVKHCGFEPAQHHRLIIEKLTAVAEGRIKNLILLMPPGSGKSIYASVWFVCWFLARYPTKSIISASHTVELAESWGRKVRNLISEHSATLGIAISDDSKAAGRWSLKTGGEYFAAGVGSAVVGRRADGIIIDDPVAGQEAADSKLIRDRTYDWYVSEAVTRLKPDGFRVLIQTRWHVDDLAGRIIADAERHGEHWEIVSLPAEAHDSDPLGRAPGDFLWGDQGSKFAAMLAERKRTTPPRAWGALYQQTPIPETGNYFEEAWLKATEELPPLEELNIYAASDFAVTKNGGDWTVHLIVGLDDGGRMYLLDVWRRRTDTATWIEALLDLAQRYKPLVWAFEGGQIYASVGPFLQQRAIERGVYVAPKEIPSRHDKSVRAQSIRGRMALHGLYVPIRASWYPEFLAEVLTFPAGRHDDQVDSLSLIGQLMTYITPKAKLQPPRPIKLLSPPLGDDRYIGTTLEDLWEIADHQADHQLNRRQRI